MEKLVWFNGKVTTLEEAAIPAADHAHLYGDGLFEGIRIYHSKVFKLDAHLDRLYYGCKMMGFAMEVSQGELRQTILDLCAQSGVTGGYIRVNVTRGTGLGLDPRAVKTAPNVMVMVSSLALYPPEFYETGLDAMFSSVRVIAADSLDPRLKCIGRYASNIMAKAEANRAGVGEALLLNHDGFLTEGTGENIFLVKDGKLRTPHPSCGILRGITRDTVMSLAATAGIACSEENLTPYDVFEADECFCTGTAAEVVAVVKINGQLIGDGKPGPVCRKLTDLFREHTHTGVPFAAHAGARP
ncbi:MAG: branched-chain-amino-acid transaminase [Fimbriimonadaceae bacterium]|nr:branched-chain-amino-acid transaminase [Fimbriimonadaceae bacterium]